MKDGVFAALSIVFSFPFKLAVYYGVISSLPSVPWYLWFAFNGYIISTVLLAALKAVVDAKEEE